MNINAFARLGYIEVSIGGKTKTVYVSQQGIPPTDIHDGLANCYLVVPSSNVLIPVTRAITVGGMDASVNATVITLWDDNSVINGSPRLTGYGASRTIKVNASSRQGNAVIALKDDTGAIRWSWHIWVTDYDPDNGGATYTNTYNTNNNGKLFVFMDRNLGATKASLGYGLGTGLFYQWGRKDPFPATLNPGETQLGGGSFTTAATSSLYGEVEYTIKHPNVFITSDNDWLYAARDNTLWGHSVNHSKPKTIYDPCPSGWRVPVNSGSLFDTNPWYGFTKENATSSFNSGYSWGTYALYPAAGHRDNGSGTLYYTGKEGSHWSASPYSSSSYYASYLVFNSFNAGGGGYRYRAYGFSVRCTQE
jgi:hypothetical protein